ncbi:integrase catalytic domain-containing protein [Mycobacterium sp. C3-094]
MIDEHTRESLLHLVERSITGEVLVAELTKVFASHGGLPKVLRMDNGPEMVFSSAATVLRGQDRHDVHPAGLPVGQQLHRFVQQPTTQGVPQPQPLEHPVRGPRGHRRLQTRAQSPTPALSPGIQDAGRVRCHLPVHPHSGGMQHQLRMDHTNPTLEPGGLSNGDSPMRSSWKASAAILTRPTSNFMDTLTIVQLEFRLVGHDDRDW